MYLRECLERAAPEGTDMNPPLSAVTCHFSAEAGVLCKKIAAPKFQKLEKA